jgi:hypothetical protein
VPSATYNIVADQGATWYLTITYEQGGNPINLTGWSARLQVREGPGSVLLIDASTANGRITLGGSTGNIAIVVPASVMATVLAGTWQYDLQVTSTDNPPIVTRLLAGTFTVTPELVA